MSHSGIRHGGLNRESTRSAMKGMREVQAGHDPIDRCLSESPLLRPIDCGRLAACHVAESRA